MLEVDGRGAADGHEELRVGVPKVEPEDDRRRRAALAVLADRAQDRHALRRVTARVLLRAVRGRTELRPRELCTWW